ncbi:MAG TPA: putative 2OG-Fe(II) oxygenase [Steroidobacteraceae bacterium]|nr:putative 2OG-Fe(II) oxygenase [Steroidobacteraceae bacterium]
MVSPSVKVRPAFAVPIGEVRLAPCEGLNGELEALFLARENDEHRNPTPSHIPQNETFESRFNLFRWPDPCVQELRRFVLDAVARTVIEATSLTAEDLSRLKLHNHTWFHVSRYAGSFIAHNHPLASWSAVYCVRPGEAVAEQPDSGLLRFFDPRQGADAYSDPTNLNLLPAFAPRSIQMRLEAGALIVFPSYLFHEVAPFYGRDTRITVASNCWFVE